MRVALVLRRSHEYDTDYVEHLTQSLWAHTPQTKVFCLTDAPILPDGVERIPLEYDWPGYFCKLELFRPDLTGDFLYFDLDTVITGDVSEFFDLPKTALLSDLYRPELAQSGVMFLRQPEREYVWRALKEIGVNETIRKFRGDGEFLHSIFPEISRIQDLLPGRIVSYKGDEVAERGVPDGATVICFHGKPRPREVNWRVR